MTTVLSVARQRRLAPVIGPLIAAAFLQACMSWKPEPLTAEQFRPGRDPRIVRVTLADSTQVNLRDPVLQGDSLVGHEVASGAFTPGDTTVRFVGRPSHMADTLTARRAAATDTGRRVAFALRDVRAVEVLKTDAAMITLGFVGGMCAMLALVAVGFAVAGDNIGLP